jgi:hypothetical protein
MSKSKDTKSSNPSTSKSKSRKSGQSSKSLSKPSKSIPSNSSQNKGNLPCILLDLDQTCISAEPEEEYDWKKNKKKATKFEFADMDGYYIVFARPGLNDFLDYLFKNFNVSVWTAASKDYALFIIDKLIIADKPERELDWTFFSYHCDNSKHHNKRSKCLKMLWDVYNIEGYTDKNTVILDDYDEVYKTQPGNCIKAPPFEFTDEGSENDTFFTDLQPKLDVMIAAIKDGKESPAAFVNDS